MVSTSDWHSGGPGFESCSDHFAGFVLGCPEFRSLATLVNSQLVASSQLGFLIMLWLFELFISNIIWVECMYACWISYKSCKFNFQHKWWKICFKTTHLSTFMEAAVLNSNNYLLFIVHIFYENSHKTIWYNCKGWLKVIWRKRNPLTSYLINIDLLTSSSIVYFNNWNKSYDYNLLLLYTLILILQWF